MAFPTTPVLDAFGGATAAPPNANWTQVGGFTADLQRNGSGVAKNNSASLAGGDYWNPATFARPCEVYVTIVTLPSTTNKRTTLYLLTQNPGSASTRGGYLLEWTWITGAANDTWTLQRVDNNVKTQLGSTLTGNDLVAGDKIGLGIDGVGNLTAYSNTGGTWAPLALTFLDTTYTAAGNVGLSTVEFSGGPQTMDDFGGGGVVVPVLPNPLLMLLSHQDGGIGPPLLPTLPLQAPAVTTPVSATAGLPYDADGGVASALDLPLDADGGVSSGPSLPLEAAQGIVQPGSAAPVEAGQGVATTAAGPVEATGGVAAPASDPVEAAQAIAGQTASVPVESATGLAAVGQACLEALGGVASTISDALEAVGGVASTVLDAVESLLGITTTAPEPVEALQGTITPVSQTASMPIEALGFAPLPPDDGGGHGGSGFPPELSGKLAEIAARRKRIEDEETLEALRLLGLL